MKYILSTLAILVFYPSIAQISFNNPDEGNVISFQTTEIDPKDVKTDGSPYLDEEFKMGKIYIRGQEKLSGKLRYNAYNSEIELQKGETEYSGILKRNYISARIGEKLYKILSFEDEINGNIRTGYFIALNEGNVQLLFKPEVKIRRGRTASTNYDREIPPRFIDVSSYYIKNGDNTAKKIYLRKKSFYDELGKKNVQEYLRKNNAKLSRVEDAIKFIDYYNQNLSN